MATTVKLTAPSPADKAEMIRRHFPALLPRFNADTGNIECPSMTDRDTVYTITTHQTADGATEFHCDCKSTRTCTHILLATEIEIRGMIRPSVHLHTDPDFDARWGHVLKATA